MAGMTLFQYHGSGPKAFASLVSNFGNIGIMAMETKKLEETP